MASIDEVIERSRQQGSFSERKRFTVARSSAIQKMRKFALADPSHYILEWIQAAIANGATYLDVAVDATSSAVSYVGGGFARGELESLFEFLFASKDDLDVADVRQLALGVNGLLSGAVSSVVIESGDGTMDGTTRVEIDPRSDSVSVGRPMQALDGTFIRASGFSRELFGSLPELRAIEDRCLTAPIPILVNDQPLFGYSSVRCPNLWGYGKTLKFDEGDLYGTIGVATTPITRDFKLLTWGTWIRSVRRDFPGLPAMGGVVGYDRLRKTADHASIVQDEVYEEMWARISVYARQLAGGQTGAASFEVRILNGDALTARAFREMARERGRAVLFDRAEVASAEARELAARYGAVFDAPVFVAPAAELETLRYLGGAGVEVFMPRLDADELAFYERPVAEDPPRPWLTPELELPEIDRERLALSIANDSETQTPIERDAATAVRANRSIRARLFTPSALPPDTELWVEIRLAQRTIWAASVECPYPGHHLVIELDELPVSSLRRAAVCLLLARAIAAEAQPVIAQAAGMVVDALRPNQPLSPAARRVVLAAVARRALRRLRSGADGVQVRFTLEGDALKDVILELELLQTFGGRVLSIRDLERLMAQSDGLVYGAPRGTVLDETLDANRVIEADAVVHRLLIELVGRLSYVDVGATEVVAEAGTIRCAALLPGLGTVTGFPFAVRGLPPASADERSAAADELAKQLLEAWQEPNAPLNVLRHLLWHVGNSGDALNPRIAAAPLFRTADGHAVSFQNVRAALESSRGLVMFDGWSTHLSWGTPLAPDAEQNGVSPLANDPFTFHCLARRGRIRPILDADLSAGEAASNPSTPSEAFIEAEDLHGSLEGRLGLPVRPVEDASVIWLHRKEGTAVALREVGRDFGVVGRVVGPPTLSITHVRTVCEDASWRMYDRLIRRLPTLVDDPDLYHRALEILLDYTKPRVRFAAGPDRSLSLTVTDALARRILDLPICPTTAGVSVPARRVLHEFAIFGDRRPRAGRAQLGDAAAPVLRSFFDELFAPDRIVDHQGPGVIEGDLSARDLWLTAALNALRTDEASGDVEIRIISPEEFDVVATQAATRDAEIVLHNLVVFVNAASPLVRRLGDPENRDAEAASWLLLAVYARMNEVWLHVTNIDELHFQSRVLDWLDAS